MQPPIEHPYYDYRHDEDTDRQRYGWAIVKYATYAVLLATFLMFVLR